MKLVSLARSLPSGEPIGVTIAEYVRFRRTLCRRAPIFHPVMIYGHRVVLIPSDWRAA